MCKQKTFSDCAYCTKTKAFFFTCESGLYEEYARCFFAMARSRSTDLSELLATAENFVSMELKFDGEDVNSTFLLVWKQAG